MNSDLIIAYDLKHQIENLPLQQRDSKVVDGGDTELTMHERICSIIIALETEGRT